MQWGISFKIPATFESDMLGLPPPSSILRLQNGDGKETTTVFYHFLHAPQSKKEWQRVAGIKVQLKNRIPSIKFEEYEPLDILGKVYNVSELGSYFKDFVKFPAPFFEGTPQAILTRHAKRLHYEGLLHVEQLIFASLWIKDIAPKGETGRRKKDEGIGQIMRRALSAYQFALDHRENWKVKLSVNKRHKVLSQSALKAAQAKRDNSQAKRERAKCLRSEGEKLSVIADLLEVSYSTVKRWTKQ